MQQQAILPPISSALTLHTLFYSVDKLVGLAAVQQGSDGRERVQDDGLRVCVNVVLKTEMEIKTSGIIYRFLKHL